ncbi:hypothetical protein BCR41DRAFT_139221 [Lobosporangium transversale]|uniref:Uncharacterized protein n=1 Tax=Lobosporangium transversale TaxID=64571 RepID=A0A1Y2GJU0_9FUNG|nr:hypothetical protein BCR41DRAFT_139221 [Lobosporangium transversale]ORZ09435.1 hypothetical protein BCR41DRAFT_139221 [Lobosporangium transversale]|eukprot:XP_021878888.1 hypothetical protein BCR41DRAFT_139221 [Lobosporangium transversale]
MPKLKNEIAAITERAYGNWFLTSKDKSFSAFVSKFTIISKVQADELYRGLLQNTRLEQGKRKKLNKKYQQWIDTKSLSFWLTYLDGLTSKKILKVHLSFHIRQEMTTWTYKDHNYFHYFKQFIHSSPFFPLHGKGYVDLTIHFEDPSSFLYFLNAQNKKAFKHLKKTLEIESYISTSFPEFDSICTSIFSPSVITFDEAKQSIREAVLKNMNNSILDYFMEILLS